MQCDKSDDRGILAGLEGITGKKAINSDAPDHRVQTADP